MNLLKQFVLVSLALNAMMSTLLIPVALMDYSIRKDYIEKVLCIERDKPMSTCKGSCYLFSRLKKATSQQKSDSEVPSFKLTISFFLHKAYEVCALQTINGLKSRFPRKQENDLSDAFIPDCFHPPQILS